MEGINGRSNLKIAFDYIHVSREFIFLMMNLFFLNISTKVAGGSKAH